MGKKTIRNPNIISVLKRFRERDNVQKEGDSPLTTLTFCFCFDATDLIYSFTVSNLQLDPNSFPGKSHRQVYFFQRKT